MNVFETNYSNLFAAGLRVIQSRRMGRRPSSESHTCSPVSPAAGTADHDEHLSASSKTSFSRRTFHFPTRLWHPPSSQDEMTSSADRNLTASTDVESKPACRMMPGDTVEEGALDVRIWARVPNASAIPEEEDGCMDPYLDKVDPVDTPTAARTPILAALPNPTPSSKHEPPLLPPLATSCLSQQDHRVSVQPLPARATSPKHPYRSFFDSDEEDTVWETDCGSASSSSYDDPGLDDDDWHQFRVEWIDFGDVAR